MRTFLQCAALASSCAAIAVVPAAAGESAPAASPAALTGHMTSMQFLIGSWNCSVKLPAGSGEPATTDHGVVAYSVVPGNAIHAHVTAMDYADDSYIGYVDKAKLFWTNTIDAYGALSGETSTDGKLFTGSSAQGQVKMKVRDTISRPKQNTTRDLQEFQSNGSWHMASDSTCTRI
jgi:hypothetical protein